MVLLAKIYLADLCDPSQNGALFVNLQLQILAVRSSSTVKIFGPIPVPLCDPSQNGAFCVNPHWQ